MNLHVKRGDSVLVLAGKDKGAKGKVLSAYPGEKRSFVVVDGVNMVSRHKKPRSAQDQGGIIKRPGNIDVSNVQVICPVCGKATRIAHKVGEDGKKFRSCKKCGGNLDAVKKEKKKDKDKKDKPVKEIKEEVKTEEAVKPDKKETKAKKEVKETKKDVKKKTETAEAKE